MARREQGGAPTSGAPTANALQPAPPPKAEGALSPPNWVAVVALVLSVFTLIKTIYGDLRGRSSKRGGKFDKNFGAPIRSGLREYQAAVVQLRSFALNDPRPANDQQKDIAALRVKWSDAGYKMTQLLQEADDNGKLENGLWGDKFQSAMDELDLLFEEMSDPKSDEGRIRALAKDAESRIRVAVAQVRTELESEEDSYESLKPRLWR